MQPASRNTNASTGIVIRIGFLFSLIVTGSAYAQNKLDTGFLGATPTPAAAPTVAQGSDKPKGGNRSKAIALEEKKADSNAQKDAVATINSLTLILRNTQPGAARNKLLLNHATALNLFARLKILASKQSSPTEDIKKYLYASLKDVEEVLASPYITNDQKWRSHDVAGTSSLYLDQEDQARAHFLEVLKLNPPPDKAGRIGLMIAEDLFDQGKFKEAVQYYTNYYSKMTPTWKELALYKLGWCMINLNEPDQAENYLARVARSTSNSGVGKDAIRDLAYLTTHRTNPMSSILRVEGILKQPQDKLAFLYDVRVSLEGQGSIAVHSQIVERLLRMETNLEKQLELQLANFRVQRKLYASRDHMNAFLRVPPALKKFDEKQLPVVFKKYEAVIELEVQNLMRAYIDTYAGRTKTPEALTPAQIADALKKQFSFYYKYFSHKANFAAVVTIWRDVCLDAKDWVCVDEVSQVILSRPERLGAYAEKAYLDQIAALDFFITDKKTKDIKPFEERRALRVKEFIEKFPKSDQWITVAKIYTQGEMAAGREKIALPVLLQIMERDPNEEAFYQLQYARFKLEDYDGMLADPRSKTYVSNGSKVSELYRESSLILAQRAKDRGDVDQYRFYVTNFVNLSTDPAKARIARLDYLNFLIQKEMINDAMKEYFALPAQEYKQNEYEPFRVDFWKAAVSLGNFQTAHKFAVACEPISNKPDDWRQRRLLSNLFLGRAPSYDEMSEISNNEREYFLGLLALVRPTYVIEYYRKNNKKMSDGAREILALSYKIHLDQWRLLRTPGLEEALGSNYQFGEKISKGDLPIEKLQESVTFPSLAKMSAKRQQAAVGNNIQTIQDLRKKVLKAIQGKPLEIQLRVLERSRDIEAKMAEYLLNSPIPSGLTPEQVEQYKSGIKTAAEEYTQQSQQFEVLAAKSREEIEKGAKYLESRTLPQPEMDRWEWPTGTVPHPQLKWIFEMMKNGGNVLGALALLDYYRPTLVKADDAYYNIRTGALMSSGKSPAALRIYLLDELERNKQYSVMKIWGTLVNRPLPGVL